MTYVIYTIVVANKMKTVIQTLIVLTFLCSCGQKARQQEPEIQVVDKSQSESPLIEKFDNQIIKKKFGEELFKSILDTITVNNVNVDFLTRNKWIYRPFDNCESFLKFQENGIGVSYNCEMEEEYEMTYRIEGNKVFIAEYDIPHVDNEEHKRIKFRDDTYVYNSNSLVMVDSKMYNIGGLEWIPKIEVVIDYKRKKY
ncbi:hypothetical protein SAMN04488007_3640 [Maribacter aquivivus]|uniref:Uncharacterized protein n=2 Tax=Maribacter aquivivus TaxID=228958 RepID=A0A1M6UH28_9FLAO|nr:hypothetical protein SAMN04488007_3640 [Maribacter aquivivus]